MTISGPSIGRVGEDLVLTCGVRVVEHLIAKAIVHVEWSGGSLGSGNGVVKHINGSYISNTLMLNDLFPSHGAMYTCQAEINISSLNLLKMASDNINVIIQCKHIYYKYFWIYVNHKTLPFSLPFTIHVFSLFSSPA